MIPETSNDGLPSDPPPSLKGRMLQLDVLRGVAILLVLLRHAAVPWSFAGPARGIMLALWRIGWTGVDLFFVLSGFLIGGLLFKEIRKTGTLDVKRFLVRRGMKIWPAYLVYIAFVFIVIAWQEGAGKSFHAVLPNLLHLQNYLTSPRGQTWSLAVEEHFYLVLPVFLLALLAWRPSEKAMSVIPVAAAVLIVACTSMRLIFLPNRPFDMWTHQAPTHLRIDGLFFGVLIAYLYHLKPDFLARVGRHRVWLILIGLALISPMALHDISERAFIWTIGFTMLYVGYGMILVALIYTRPGDGLLGKVLSNPVAGLVGWIGIYSYSIYLWQFDVGVAPVERWVLPHLPRHPLTLLWLLGTLCYLALSVLGGVIAAKLVELPALAVRDRFFPARTPGQAVDRVADGVAPGLAANDRSGVGLEHAAFPAAASPN